MYIVLFKSDQGVDIYEAYSVKSSTNFEELMGTWSASEGLQIDQPYIWNRRTDLKGFDLACSLLPYTILTLATIDEDGRVLNTSGFLSVAIMWLFN